MWSHKAIVILSEAHRSEDPLGYEMVQLRFTALSMTLVRLIVPPSLNPTALRTPLSALTGNEHVYCTHCVLTMKTDSSTPHAVGAGLKPVYPLQQDAVAVFILLCGPHKPMVPETKPQYRRAVS